MTEQARLTGDSPKVRLRQRTTNPKLNDSMVYDRSEIIAFSGYAEAIDRISHQYSLWEDAQNEFCGLG